MKCMALISVLSLAINTSIGQSKDLYVKLAGVYHVAIKGYADGSEAFALRNDGAATWVYGWKDASGQIKTQTKSGTWIVSVDTITITISGNTGSITEKYKLQNGVWRNVEDRDRSLKKK